MSIVFDLECEGRVFQIELFEDLHYQFVDEDVQAMLEVEAVITGEPSECLQIFGALSYRTDILIREIVRHASEEQLVEWAFDVVDGLVDSWENTIGHTDINNVFEEVVEAAKNSIELGRYTEKLEHLRKLTTSEKLDISSSKLNWFGTKGTLYAANLGLIVVFANLVRLYFTGKRVDVDITSESVFDHAGRVTGILSGGLDVRLPSGLRAREISQQTRYAKQELAKLLLRMIEEDS